MLSSECHDHHETNQFELNLSISTMIRVLNFLKQFFMYGIIFNILVYKLFEKLVQVLWILGPIFVESQLFTGSWG